LSAEGEEAESDPCEPWVDDEEKYAECEKGAKPFKTIGRAIGENETVQAGGRCSASSLALSLSLTLDGAMVASGYSLASAGVRFGGATLSAGLATSLGGSAGYGTVAVARGKTLVNAAVPAAVVGTVKTSPLSMATGFIPSRAAYQARYYSVARNCS
jgi:hypothetical protein